MTTTRNTGIDPRGRSSGNEMATAAATAPAANQNDAPGDRSSGSAGAGCEREARANAIPAAAPPKTIAPDDGSKRKSR
jgi:hypothetical protein